MREHHRKRRDAAQGIENQIRMIALTGDRGLYGRHQDFLKETHGFASFYSRVDAIEKAVAGEYKAK